MCKKKKSNHCYFNWEKTPNGKCMEIQLCNPRAFILIFQVDSDAMKPGLRKFHNSYRAVAGMSCTRLYSMQ